jgi:hypothetical protein
MLKTLGIQLNTVFSPRKQHKFDSTISPDHYTVWNHTQKDVFDIDFTATATTTVFDVVIIDIEPHGREIDVYEKIKCCMSPQNHLVILKHVANMDIFGSVLAHGFIKKYMDSRDVVDFFAESSFSSCGTRDVFVVMGRGTTTQTLRSMMRGKPGRHIVSDGVLGDSYVFDAPA